MKSSQNNNKKYGLIAGTRPNFVKLAPLARAFQAAQLSHVIIHAGQHYDDKMSGDFFKDFGVNIDVALDIVREPVVAQLADMMRQLEQVFITQGITDVIVMGDVNATLAAALTAQKMGLRVAHVEAGLRSYNYQMPEEINRILVDTISDLLFASSEDAAENLQREGARGKVFTVGNIMIDNLLHFLPTIPLTDEKFYFCTLHRAENVDHPEVFGSIITALQRIKDTANVLIYLPLHPRTKKKAEEFGLLQELSQTCTLLEPLPYAKTLYYQKNAQLILTDSGGIQEEASVLGVPCLTLRTETERPITVELGTNSIGGVTTESIMKAYGSMKLQRRQVKIPLWDGHTAERIVDILQQA